MHTNLSAQITYTELHSGKTLEETLHAIANHLCLCEREEYHIYEIYIMRSANTVGLHIWFIKSHCRIHELSY